MQIDRNSPRAYYLQLFDALSEQIDDGTIAAGERLASENDLCTEYGLSRATVRQTLRLLESHRLVTRVPGRGVFAKRQDREHGWVIQGAGGFLDNALDSKNGSVTTSVLRAAHGPLPRSATQELQIPVGSRGFELVRVRSVDGVPALFSTNYSPPPIDAIVGNATEVLDGTGSLTEVLRTAGYTTGGANRVLHGLATPEPVAQALEITAGTPILRIRSTSWDDRDRRYDFYETWLRTDVIPVEINVSSMRMPLDPPSS
jgi:GntR family transcriptional regulator